MHPNPAFRKTPTERNIAFAKQRAFGVLAINADDGPLVSHIPFQFTPDGGSVEAHLVRSNPIARLLTEPRHAVIAVSGGDAYISPDWYNADDQVPTWNYVAVHIRGTLERLKDEALHGILERLSANMEERLAPKKEWTIDKMDEDIYVRMKRQIVPVRMTITKIEGTWKLSQNKPAEVRASALDGLKQTSGAGAEIDSIIALMGEVQSH